MSDNENPLGSPEEIAEAREKLAAIQDNNSLTSIRIIDAINKRIALESATLSAVLEASPHLFTRFLMKEAASSLGQASRMLSAALDLHPIDEGEINKEGGIVFSNLEDNEGPPGTGQYL